MSSSNITIQIKCDLDGGIVFNCNQTLDILVKEKGSVVEFWGVNKINGKYVRQNFKGEVANKHHNNQLNHLRSALKTWLNTI